MTHITEILFAISNGLMIPVIILLLAMLLWALVLAFGFFAEYSAHSKWVRVSSKQLADLSPDNAEAKLSGMDKRGCRAFDQALGQLLKNRHDAAACERIVANYEVDTDKALSRYRMLIKLGPMLGLMGTLIPMGPALVGLATGDIASMAYNMQVAFATTVVGMLIAGIGVVILASNKRFYARTVNDLQFIAEVLAR